MSNTKIVNWDSVLLENVVEKIIGGGTPSRDVEEYYEGNIPWFTVKDMIGNHLSKSQEYITEDAIQNSATNLIEANNVIVATRIALGKAFINECDIAINQDLKALIPKKNSITSEYLLLSILGQSEKIVSMGSGTTVKGIRLEQLKKLSILLPSLKEQQKIAEILSSVDAAIEKTEQVIAKTEEVKKGLMQQLLTKGIGHTEFKDSKVGLIPKSWHLIDFIGVADSNIDYSFTGGPFGSDLKSEDYTENGVRIIQLQNIKDGYFNDDYKIFTSEEKANKLKSCNIYPGEIIIAKMADPLARACLVPDKDSRYLMASDGIRLSIDKCKFDTDFVLYSINSIYFRNQAEEVSTGTTRLRIGLSALKKLQFKVPPLEEQKRIGSIILSFDNKIKSEQEKLIKLKECKKGLMQQLLTGQVRVGSLC